jgi:CMP-2-keto-3-deoxyoctulosonic acid synthetase
MISDITTQLKLIKKICGLFGITNSALQQVLSKQNTPVASNESIEQLKFLEMGIPLGFCVLESDFPSVNLKKDLDLVIKILANNEHQAEILKSIL